MVSATGSPAATSCAKLGPSSAPVPAAGSTDPTTWWGRKSVDGSMPLQSQINRGGAPRSAAIDSSVGRNPATVVATTISDAGDASTQSSTSRKCDDAVIDGCSVTPGRYR